MGGSPGPSPRLRGSVSVRTAGRRQWLALWSLRAQPEPEDMAGPGARKAHDRWLGPLTSQGEATQPALTASACAGGGSGWLPPLEPRAAPVPRGQALGLYLQPLCPETTRAFCFLKPNSVLSSSMWSSVQTMCPQALGSVSLPCNSFRDEDTFAGGSGSLPGRSTSARPSVTGRHAELWSCLSPSSCLGRRRH